HSKHCWGFDMRRFIRQTLAFIVLSAATLMARPRNSTSGDPGNTRTETINDPSSPRGQRTVTSILDYAGGKWKDGRVREVRSDGATPRDRKPHRNDDDWSNQDKKYQPQYGDLDKH